MHTKLKRTAFICNIYILLLFIYFKETTLTQPKLINGSVYDLPEKK